MAIQTTAKTLDSQLREYKRYRFEAQVDDNTGEVMVAIWGMREGKYLASAKASIEKLPTDFQAIFSQFLLLKEED